MVSYETFDTDFKTNYSIKKEGNGVCALYFKGSFTVWNHHRYTDGVGGFLNTDSFAIIANSADAEILLMEVPMRL
jgi:hypothetical protein